MYPRRISAPFNICVPRDRLEFHFFASRPGGYIYIYIFPLINDAKGAPSCRVLHSLSAILFNIMSAVFDIIFAGGELVCTSRSRELCSSSARRNDCVCHRREISCRRPFSQDPHRRKWSALSRRPSPCPALQIHRAPRAGQHYRILPCRQSEPTPQRTCCCRSMRSKRGRRLRCQL